MESEANKALELFQRKKTSCKSGGVCFDFFRVVYHQLNFWSTVF